MVLYGSDKSIDCHLKMLEAWLQVRTCFVLGYCWYDITAISSIFISISDMNNFCNFVGGMLKLYNVERSSTVTHASKYKGRANVDNVPGSSASFFIKHFSAYKHPGPMTEFDKFCLLKDNHTPSTSDNKH